jgi:multicomponent Na+:H+ antiporter subunit E
MMGLFAFNLILAFVWSAVTGGFTLLNLTFGFVLGAIVLLFIRHSSGSGIYFKRFFLILSLLKMFFIELVLSAWSVLKLSFSRDLSHLKPGFFAYNLKVKSDLEITLLANMITLTPGTLSVDVSDNRKTLYIHAIHVPDPQQTIHDIRAGFEQKIIEAFQ